MSCRIIGTEGRQHSSRAKGYRSNELHHLRQEDRATRSLQPVRIQSAQPDRRTSTAPQRSRSIPSPFPDRIRNSQHRAQHWNKCGGFGFHDGNRATANPSRLGIHDPLRSQTDKAGHAEQRANHRRRSLGERNLPPDPSRLVNAAAMGRRLRPRNTDHACQRKGSCQTLLRTAPANPMPKR